MYLQDYGDEPVKVVTVEELLPPMYGTYQDPDIILDMAKNNPGVWYRVSPYSWFCYVKNSPYRT